MLRRICLLLIVSLFFAPTAILAGEQSSEKLAEGFLHENIYTENNELKAERTTEVNVDIKNLKITKDDIKDGSIDGVEEKSKKFEVLSINVLDDFILMYLSENSNAYKIKIYHNNTGEDLFYNRYWYLEFIDPEIKEKEVEVFTPFAYNTNYMRKYERTYNIWSDYYTEELNLLINFNWPEVTRATSAGDIFTSKIQIMSKFTHVTEYSGRKYTLSGSSLKVAGATVRHGTDQGQYVKEIYH